MTTITPLNVRLGMDVSNFSEGANLAKSEVSKVATIMRQSVPPAEKYKQELDLLNRAFSESGKKSKEYANAVEFLKGKHEGATAAIHGTARASTAAGSSAESAMGSIKGMAAAYLSVAAATSAFKKSINLASEIEDSTIAFEVLTGSAKDGALIFEQIRKFAAESPITFSGATQAAKTMMSFNVAAQDVEKNLRMLSDVTGGNNERFKMMALAFSQTSAAGRLMGQDVLQMINAGFNPLQQISKTTGESMIELKARMEDGGISADEVRRAFEDATAQGGMFHGMTERLSETISGKMNIALSDMEQKLAEVGETLIPMLSMSLDILNEMKPVINFVVNAFDQLSMGMRLQLAMLKDLISSVKNFEFNTSAINEFHNELRKRGKQRHEEAAEQSKQEFDKKLNNVDTVAQAEKRAALETARAAADAHSKAVKDHEKAAKAAEDTRAKRIQQTLRETDELVKQSQREAKQAQQDFQRELESARSAAMKFFEDQQKKNEQRRADVARGPGAGMEVGSAEAVKFAADAVNAQIAQAAVPDDPATTNRDIAAKTAELLVEQREAHETLKRQLRMAERQLAAMEENGFRRIR